MILTPPTGYRFSSTVFSHGWVQLPPFDHIREPRLILNRILRLGDGALVKIQIEADGDNHRLQITADQSLNKTQSAEVQAILRRCLSMDQDLAAFYDTLRDHSRYHWVEQHGAGRLLIGATVWEDLAKTLLTTNTTWAMTRQMVGRLVTLGDAHADGHAFPTPQQVAALSPEALNAHVRAGYRGDYLHTLAASIAEERVDVEAWYTSDLPSADLYKRIRSLKGFGDYAAGSVLRLLGRHDFLGIDSVARDMYRTQFNGGEKVPDSVITAHYEPYGEWRGLMLWMDVIAPEETT